MFQKIALLLAFFMLITNVNASVVFYTNKAQWQAAVNNDYETINFTGYPAGTTITTQYQAMGVVFTDGNDFIHLSSSYPNDGAGLYGNEFADDQITIRFTVQQNWIAVDHAGIMFARLYQNDVLLYSFPGSGGGGTGFFLGFVSDEPFNRVVYYRPDGTAPPIDDLFYQQIPAPGAMGLLAIGALISARRRHF